MEAQHFSIFGFRVFFSWFLVPGHFLTKQRETVFHTPLQNHQNLAPSKLSSTSSISKDWTPRASSRGLTGEMVGFQRFMRKVIPLQANTYPHPMALALKRLVPNRMGRY